MSTEEETKPEETPTTKPVSKRPPRIPIGELLAHGDPETRNLPKTWKETLGFPLVLSVIFFISMLTFHYAPHEKSVQQGVKLPKGPRPNFDGLKKYREQKAAESLVEEEKPEVVPPPTPQQVEVEEEGEVPVPMEDLEPQQEIPQENPEKPESIPVPAEEAEETDEEIVAAEETSEIVEETKEEEQEESEEAEKVESVESDEL